MKNKKAFVPVAGLMVAGLVGAAYATCYGYTTFTCANTGIQVGTTQIACDQFRAVYAKVNWLYNDNAVALDPGQSGFSFSQVNWGTVCSGPAVYTDCFAVQRTISNFPSNWGLSHDPVDTTATPDCIN
jgi:hypothetical protein